MSGIFSSIEISGSGLSTQRRKMDTVAENIANVDTTKTKKGGPYQRKRVIVKETGEASSFGKEFRRAHNKLARTNSRHIQGSSTTRPSEPEYAYTKSETIADPASSFKLIHDPSHPDANKEGFVKMPDIEIVHEMVDMVSASRAYEANIAAISTSKKMIDDALDI